MKRLLVLLTALCFGSSFTQGQTLEEMMANPGAYNFYDIKETAEAHFAKNGRERGSGYKPYKRWEIFMEPRVSTSGNILNGNKIAMDEFEKYVKSAYYQNLSSEKTHNGFWQQLSADSWVDDDGWNPGLGRINRIAFDPANANVMYAGSALGGLWRSTNQGVTWNPMTDGMTNLGISGIAVHPSNSNTIYALTGDGDGGHTPTIGVIRTTNGGVSWQLTDDFIGSNANSLGGQTNHPRYSTKGYELIIDPTNGNRLFAATTDGIFRTINGGLTWTNVRTGSFRDVKFKPGDPQTVYAVTTTAFWRSTDGGTTWTSIAAGLPSSDFTRIAIGVSPTNSSYVYLIYGGGSTGFRGIYRSLNSGTSFSLRSSTPNIFGSAQDGSGTRHQANYDIAIAVSPTDINDIIMGGINTWRSTNGGTSWTVTSDWNTDNAATGKYCHADIHYLGYNGNTLWTGTDGGVFRSTDDGNTWTNRSTGLDIMQFYKICTRGGEYYGGTQDNGTNRITNNTASHIRGADGFACIAPEGASNLYASTQSTYYRRNTDGTWSNITPSAFEDIDPWNVDWINRPGSSSRLFIGTTTGSVLRTTDSGANWTDINANMGTGRVFNLAMGNSNTNRLYIATRTNLRRTDNVNDASPTYTTITSGLPATRSITGIAVDPTNSNRIFVCLSGYNDGEKVYRSNDAGASWTNISGSLPNVPVNCIVHDDTPGGVYIGTDLGVFYRNNSTGGWLPFMNGLPNTVITDLEIRADEQRLYAGTFGRGMWRSDLHSACLADWSVTPSSDPSSSMYTGYQFYSASNSFTSSRIITGGLGTDVTYRAGNYVDLVEGFHAREGSEFLAETGPCNAVFTPLETLATGILEGSIHDSNNAISFDANLRKSIRAYPNPFVNSFNLEVAAVAMDRKVFVEVYDLSGRVVLSLNNYHILQGQRLVLEINTPQLSPGAYILQVRDGEEIHSFKMIKQH